MQRLTSQLFPAPVAYQIKLMAEKMQKQRTKISEEYRELVEKFATRDVEGKIVHPNADDTNSFDVDPAKMTEYKAEETAFGEREFTINVSQISLRDLAKTEFTPAELGQLDALIAKPLEVTPASVTSITSVPETSAETGGVA